MFNFIRKTFRFSIEARDGFFLFLCETFPLSDKAIDLIILALNDRLEFTNISRITKVELEQYYVERKRNYSDTGDRVCDYKINKVHRSLH